MNDIGLMYEQASDAEWERQNAPVIDGETLRQAARSLMRSIEELDKAADNVNEAAETLVDTPVGDRVSAILNDMENLLSDIKIMQKKFAKGVIA